MSPIGPTGAYIKHLKLMLFRFHFGYFLIECACTLSLVTVLSLTIIIEKSTFKYTIIDNKSKENENTEDSK